MARSEFLDELSDDFPCKSVYSYDERFRFDTERHALMDAVLEGTFEKYEHIVKESAFSYAITADAEFLLEVKYKEEGWIKTFSYVAEAFDVAEAALRFFVVVPRVLDAGELLIASERGLPMDHESRNRFDHCERGPQGDIDSGMLREYCAKGRFIMSTVSRGRDGSYIVNVTRRLLGVPGAILLNETYVDGDFAELIAEGYVTHFDRETWPARLADMYQEVYRRVTH